jgi:hypothetical protein
MKQGLLWLRQDLDLAGTSSRGHAQEQVGIGACFFWLP